MYANRRRQLMKRVSADAFAVICLDRWVPGNLDAVNLRYLSGYTGEGILIVRRGNSVLITDHRYTQRARQETDTPIREVSESYDTELAAVISELGIQTIGYSAFRTTVAAVNRIAALENISLYSLDDPVARLRVIKDATEVESIRRAIRITEECLLTLLDEPIIGHTELDLARKLEVLILEAGAAKSFDFVIASGPNSFIGHHRPGNRTIQLGDFLLCDVGAQVDGYCADITRTFAVGKPDSKMEAIYETARNAGKAGLQAMRPGARLVDVKNAVAEAIANSPFPSNGRIPGHGLGTEVHEWPNLRSESMTGIILEPGMVMTMEPGIYIEGYGGVRIEHDVLITKTSSEILSSFPFEEIASIG